MKKTLFLILMFSVRLLWSQELPIKSLQKSLKADVIEMDPGNGDGTFRARNKKTKKWGMYQWTYTGTNTNVLIPAQYDSIRFIPFNAAFTIVYEKDQAGVYLSAWSYDVAQQTVSCKYDDFQRFNVEDRTYLAMKKASGWGWVNWLTGEEMSSFEYDTIEDLPYPNYFQAYSQNENP